MSNPIYTNSANYNVEYYHPNSLGVAIDISSYVRKFNVKNKVSMLGDRVHIGTATLIIDNADKSFTPQNTLSSHYGNFVLNSPIYIVHTLPNTELSMIWGRIKTIDVNPQLGARYVSVTIQDEAQKFKVSDFRSPLHRDKPITTILNSLFASAELTYSPFVDADIGSYSVPYYGKSTNNAGKLLQTILDSGHHYFYPLGYGPFQVNHRNYELGLTTTASLSEFKSFRYKRDIDSIINYIKVKGSAKLVESNVATLTNLIAPQELYSGTWTNFFLSFQDFNAHGNPTEATSVSNPIAGTDWLVTGASDGTGLETSSQCSLYLGIFGDSVICSLYNGGPSGFLTQFNVYGYIVKPASNIHTVRQSTSSQGDFGKRSYELTNDFIYDIEYTKTYADFLKTKYADYNDSIEIEISNQFPELTILDLMQVVHITENETATNDRYMIIGVEHDVEGDLLHSAKYELIKYHDIGYFVLDDSTKGLLDTDGNELIF